MSYPNGVRKEVWVFIFDTKSPNSPFNSIKADKRVDLLKKLREEENVTPDFIAEGSMRSCGRFVARKLYERGFLHPVKDLAPLALGLDIAAFGEMVRLIDEQKKSGKDESVPI